MNLLREYIRAMILEKERRDQKSKRTLYHIGPRPAEPKPKQRWQSQGQPEQEWERHWLSSPVKSGVFLTPNPTDIVQFHGISGNVYAYKVPEWVIAKSGGIHRFDTGSEILIPEEVWEEAGKEIEFLGKSMSQQDLWDSVESSWTRDVKRKSTHSDRQSSGEGVLASLEGLRATSHPEAAVKMMSQEEIKKALEQLATKYEVKPDEIITYPNARKGLRIPHIQKKPDETDQQLLDLLKKHMKESVVRSYVRSLLTEVAIGQCYPHAVKMAQQSTDEEFSDLSKFRVAHGRITDKFSGESVLHAWVEKGDMIFDWQTRDTKPDGIDRETYYDIFQPEIHNEYTAEETITNCLKSGQAGPWVSSIQESRMDDVILSEDVVTGRKLDRYTTALKRHVIRAIKDPEVREYFRQAGEVQFKLQDVPEVAEIDYLRDVIVHITEGQSVNADAAYEFDLNASPEQRTTSDLRVNLVLPRDYPDQVLSQINDELVDAIRHELEHSGQETWELMDCQEKTPSADVIWKTLKNAAEYYLCPAEVKAHITGFMKRAKSNREPLGDVIDYELYKIYETGKSMGYSEADLHDFMVEMRSQYYLYAKQRYPRGQGL